MPEIEQEITRYAGHPVRVGFTPHLGPMNRGELGTATVDLAEGASVATLRELLAQRYDEEPFVHLLPEGVAPATRMVRGSNHAVVNVFADRNPRRALVIAAIDNLVKGSSGQAVQNMNLKIGRAQSELQSLMRNSYAVFCLKKKPHNHTTKSLTNYTHTIP